jgi:hypothetical protein
MTTYVYETIPRKPGEQPKYYEIRQSMKDAPLERHPETGEPIRRVMQGGFGILTGGRSRETAPPCGCAPGRECEPSGDCGGGCCCAR